MVRYRAGSVPAELIGRWGGLDDSFEFRADGTVGHSVSIESKICSTKVLENGTAVAAGSTLTLYFTTGAIDLCGTVDPYQPRVDTFNYVLETDDPSHPVPRLESVPCTTQGLCRHGYDKR